MGINSGFKGLKVKLYFYKFYLIFSISLLFY